MLSGWPWACPCSICTAHCRSMSCKQVGWRRLVLGSCSHPCGLHGRSIWAALPSKTQCYWCCSTLGLWCLGSCPATWCVQFTWDNVYETDWLSFKGGMPAIQHPGLAATHLVLWGQLLCRLQSWLLAACHDHSTSASRVCRSRTLTSSTIFAAENSTLPRWQNLFTALSTWSLLEGGIFV